jgi:hypothetical protein
MTEDEMLEAMRRNWAEERRFYSNHGKEERERWVVGELLTHRKLPFALEEITSLVQDNAVDVVFRSARFQVKEILTPAERRQDEFKDISNRVNAAICLQDTIGPAHAYDTPAPIDGYALITSKATKWAQHPKYLRSKRDLDLLFYVTRSGVSMPRAWTIDRTELSELGWRSISCLIRDQAIVLFASRDAPDFLRCALAIGEGGT